MKKFIYEVAGGIPGGKKLKAVIPGGSSCPLLKADEIDIAMDYDSVAKAGSMLGSGGMVVMDEDTCMVDMARRIMHFYAHESCGWCIPCREGTIWLRKMLERFHAGLGRSEDIDLVGELAKNMLGRAVPFSSVPFFWSNHYDVTINYVGYAEKWNDIKVAGDIASGDCVVGYMKGKKTLAVATVGRSLPSLEAEAALEDADWKELIALIAREQSDDEDED